MYCDKWYIYFLINEDNTWFNISMFLNQYCNNSNINKIRNLGFFSVSNIILRLSEIAFEHHAKCND